jgi:alcohol dehydrogenase class IV
MEMMPDVAILDPEVTRSMPARITAETGMDALTHALEAYVSRRANYLSDLMCEKAFADIFKSLPLAYKDGNDLSARATTLNASMVAGIAFTNVSLGIVHSIAHAVGSEFHIPHGLADAVALPYVTEYNSSDRATWTKYVGLAAKLNTNCLSKAIRNMNEKLGIPSGFKEIIPDEGFFMARAESMAAMALEDGCTKTNPVIPDAASMKTLLRDIYYGTEGRAYA